MPATIRPAITEDIPAMVELLLADARERHAADALLWDMAEDEASHVEKAVAFALTAEAQPFRQFWQVAAHGGRIVGVVHSMLLPVPPIYAGADGKPGLILPDSFAVPDAPEGTVNALVEAAQAVLREAGARIFLSSFVTGPNWRAAFEAEGYEPLTLYYSRSDLGDAARPSDVRLANEADVPGIVARSAENRSVLFGIDPFWAIHPEADARFDAWMRRSLTLPDRDMLVMGDAEKLEGYVIAQPASRLHFPPAHDITGTGVIDDFYHPDLAEPNALANEGAGSMALLRAAEAAFAERSTGVTFVVCPAGWRSKIELLEAAGYETAMVWSIKR
ncbi:hypothetical protein ROJ8625_03753 [Roseivivax jejudonensis]|uniref:Uncharacterized protein n=1 Tax=Roseivivax jejudonensis TaxID=1529041 RepID=A0A1X7A6I4_9RHOB|nr:hypothetical protein [Roseivivax jejudonensis]SLN71921.1 hypothetical protein ROJ8625_03753 [Roseivivax jejudonensis]